VSKKNAQTDEQETAFHQQLHSKVNRKLQAQRKVTKTIWSGLGMMGLIGWSVVVPTLLGAALGIWLDNHHPGERSWTLALLMLGLTLGCFNAWHWVEKEDQEIRKQHGNDDD
jgi:ATP synthase protein I